MRHPSLYAVAMLALLMPGACSSPQPPTGRWEGVYEDSRAVILARLEIGNDGAIRVSAPNAIAGVDGMSTDERRELKERLAYGLAVSWPQVAPMPLEFDGKAFHKPGGLAPQLEWNAGAKRMTLVFYFGDRASLRVPLAAVMEFGESQS